MKISKEYALALGLSALTFWVPAVRAADPVKDRLGVQSTMPNPNANQVLTELHRVNAMEIDMGKLAASKSANPSVQAYGQKLVTDHEDAQKKVINLASDRNVSLAMANETPSGENATTHKNTSMTQLDSLKGAAFDRAFLKHMVEGHTASVKMLRDAQPKLNDAPEVKALVTELIPVIEEHLSNANDLLKQTGKAKKAS